mmetsp:Transcript_87273/g.260348  ORF Transcript_87273/g.260348 Transcript_87273/m.260348 type:complete len:272 (+) Transcript_87273:428-1243(+)
MLNSAPLLFAAICMQAKIWPQSSPPPTASKATVAPVATSASVRSSTKLAEAWSTTFSAPRSFSTFASPGLNFSLTMLTRGTPSFRQARLSMRPMLDAAAVSTRALCPSMRMVSSMPSAAMGLTNHEEASAGLTPSGIGWQAALCMTLYCEYMSPPMQPTTFPRRAWAASELPAFTTTPPPSFPADRDLPTRPSSASIFSAGILADNAGPGKRCRVLRSACASISDMSEGLRGAASMRTTTSFGPGSGIGAETRESSTTPSPAPPLFTVLRS